MRRIAKLGLGIGLLAVVSKAACYEEFEDFKCSQSHNLPNIELSSRESIITNPEYFHLRSYEMEVRDLVDNFNSRTGLTVDPKIPLAMLDVESGSELQRYFHFRLDPLQVMRDYGRKVTLERGENTPLIFRDEEFSCLSNLEVGVGWLYNKILMGDIDPETGKRIKTGARDYWEGVLRYNGGGDELYVPKVKKAYDEM